MAELTITQLIKIILGILVVVAVIWAVYYVFHDKVGGFIENIGNSSPNFILVLIQ